MTRKPDRPVDAQQAPSGDEPEAAPQDRSEPARHAKRSSIPSAPDPTTDDCYPPARARLQEEESEEGDPGLSSHSDDVP